MNKFTYLNHNKWLEERKKGIGASEIAILCGASNWSTPLEIWETKTGKDEKEVSEDLQRLFDTGHEQEPITLYRFLKKRQPELANIVLINHVQNKKIPKKYNCHLFTKFKYNDFMFAHPDMIYEDINVEAKFVQYKSSEWNFEDNTENGIPFKYYLQCQYQMLCTGLKKTILCVNYLGSKHYEFEFKADEKIFSIFKTLCNDFWKLVENKEPPMPQTRNDVKKLFPNKEFKTITLSGNMEIDTILKKDRFNIVSKRIKKLKSEQEEIKTYVMSLMTNNNILQTSNGEEIAKIIESNSERVIALSKIKKDKPEIYKYLQKNNLINKTKSERFYF